MSKQTVILDSSQISTYYNCPQLWHLEYEDRLTAENIIDDPISCGTYGHKLLEIYYENIALGAANEDAYREAKNWTVPDDFPLTPDKLKMVKDRFELYVMTYCTRDVTPLLGEPIWYLGVDDKDNLIDCRRPKALVEQGFSYPLYENREYLFILEGKVDLIYSDHRNGVSRGWMDHKYQFRERELYSKSIQFRNYSLALGGAPGLINYIGLQKAVTDKTFRRQPIFFNPIQLREWKEELIGKFIEIAKHMREEGFYSSNRSKNRDSCVGKFGYKCQFTNLCEENEETNPALVRAIKNSAFVKREEWKPW